MYYMSREGNLVNHATNHFMCDTVEDLQSIPKTEIFLGSTAVVLEGDILKLYIANADKEWVEG